MIDSIYSGRFKVAKTKRIALKALKTSAQDTLKTDKGGKDTSIVFDNRTNKELKLYWIDEQGKKVEQDILYPGGKGLYKTFTGHIWVVSDEKGKTDTAYKALATPGNVIIK
jgi:hypothetical protein